MPSHGVGEIQSNRNGQGCISVSKGAGLGTGECRARLLPPLPLLALGQECLQSLHGILGSSQCLPELISEDRKDARVPSQDAQFGSESLPCGPDALYFKTGSEPTRVITHVLV